MNHCLSLNFMPLFSSPQINFAYKSLHFNSFRYLSRILLNGIYLYRLPRHIFFFNFVFICIIPNTHVCLVRVNRCKINVRVFERKRPGRNPANAVRLFLPILKPDLNDAHIKPCILRQLFPHMPRRFRTSIVRQLESFELLSRDRRTRPFIRLITVYAAVCQL